MAQFHCELNWIERLWGASKTFARNHCLYTLPGLREVVPISLSQDIGDVPQHMLSQLDVPVAPLFLQRRWARISRQYMFQYWKGACACDAVKAVAAQRSKRHRDTSDGRLRKVEAEMAAQALGRDNA